ncbi:hypothetical protein IAT38_002039 [Cryptococcus sp. DSM 104549]
MPPTSSAQRPSSSGPGLVKSGVNLVRALLLDRRYFWHLVSLLFVGEVLLGLLVIWKIPYTKIDWPAYMQQVEMFLGGERDYSKIEGETGPLVYPALHLYIYTAFHRFLPSIDDVRPAQYLFLGLYLITFLTVSTIYYLAGRPSSFPGGPAKNYPQILLIPLTLSKRAHSIYMLRLFNDPIAMLPLYLAVVAMMLGGSTGWRLGTVLYSLALGVKMNILLFLPGLLVLLFQYRGVLGTVEGVATIAAIQILLPAPFFLANFPSTTYFTSAFDFSRQFLYEWTVNWHFLGEKRFLSRGFAVSLLAAHLLVLIIFAAYKWSPVWGGTLEVIKNGFSRPFQPPVPASQLAANHIPLVLFTSNLIGMLFARSLHYQFYSWYFHQLPFLIYSGLWQVRRTSFIALIVGEIIWAWETSPATDYSSAGLFQANGMILVGLLVFPPHPPATPVVAENKIE